MALTLPQIQTNITNNGDARQILNQIADYLQANPGGGAGVASIIAGTNITLGGTATNPIINASPGGSSDLEEVLTEGNDAGGLAIENLADPSNDQDAATKKYVDDEIPENITTQGNTFNGASQLVQLNAQSKLPAIDGSLLTNLPGGGYTTAIQTFNRDDATDPFPVVIVADATADVLYVVIKDNTGGATQFNITVPAAASSKLKQEIHFVFVCDAGIAIEIPNPEVINIGVFLTVVRNVNTRGIGQCVIGNLDSWYVLYNAPA